MLQEMIKKIRIVQQNMKATQGIQKSYVDQCHKPLGFEEEDKVFLKVSPVKRIRCVNVKGKLSPRFVRPYDIIQKINPTAYRLALPPQLQHMHNVFHVSQLRKYVHDPTYTIMHEPLEIDANGFACEEQPVKIVDYRVK